MSQFQLNIDLSSLDGSNGFKLNGEAAYDRSGFSVASAGDVNGDGFADLMIGTYKADPDRTKPGTSYVVFGQASSFTTYFYLSSLDGSNGFRLSGEAGDDRSGRSVASAGDVNGDGFEDLIVGAVGADPQGFSSGASYVVFGKASGFAANVDLSSLNGSNGFKLSGEAAGDRSGCSVASAGDVNGDGFADLIVGAYSASPHGAAYSGASYVVFGKASGFAANLDLSSLNGDNGFKLSGEAARDNSGFPVACAGDVNGDGFDDIIVGASIAAPYGVRSGASYVVFGQASDFAANLDLSSLNGSNGFRLSGEAPGDFSGASVASAGDVNGDGFADLIVGAAGADPHGLYSGASYVVFGKATGFTANFDLSSLDGGNGFKLSGETSRDFSGGSVASAGDVNGDGFADLIVGAHGADPHGTESGAGYVVYGRAPDTAVNLSGTRAAQTLAGGAFDDRLSGFGGNDKLYGNGGNDTLRGGLDNDSLNGGAGNDVLTGHTGADVMTGGSGNDSYYVERAADQVHEIAAEGTDTVYAGNRYRLAADSAVEYLRANAGANGLALTGNELANRIFGKDGADTLRGGAGGDTLSGNSGNDVLMGGTGRDRLLGGSGEDTFTFRAVSQSPLALGDVLVDFTPGSDKINLLSIDANIGTGADDAFSLVGTAAFSHTAGELRAFASGSNTIIAGDVDGNGFADIEVLLKGTFTLGSNDFLL